MGQKKTPYEFYKSGLLAALLIAVVTPINLLLDCFGVRLLFPFSSYLTRDFLKLARKYDGFPFPLAVVLAATLTLVLIVCAVLMKVNDKRNAARVLFLLYLFDSAFYATVAIQEIAGNKFLTTHLLELLIRSWLLYALYKAQKVFFDPKRKDKTYTLPVPEKEESPTPEEEDDEDEGIQW